MVILKLFKEKIIRLSMKNGIKLTIVAAVSLSSIIMITMNCFETPNIVGYGSIDSFQVLKSKRRLLFFRNGEVSGEFRISLGFCPRGKKHFEKDGKTPEGLYKIDGKNPNSIAHKNLGISYPNEVDQQYSKKFGKKSGGSIKIHGLLNKYKKLGKMHRFYDWTAGCIAVTDEEIDYLYENTAVGTPIRILP